MRGGGGQALATPHTHALPPSASLVSEPNLFLVADTSRTRKTGIPHAIEKDDVYNGYFIPAGATIHALEWYGYLPFWPLLSFYHVLVFILRSPIYSVLPFPARLFCHPPLSFFSPGPFRPPLFCSLALTHSPPSPGASRAMSRRTRTPRRSTPAAGCRPSTRRTASR